VGFIISVHGHTTVEESPFEKVNSLEGAKHGIARGGEETIEVGKYHRDFGKKCGWLEVRSGVPGHLSGEVRGNLTCGLA